MFEKTQSKVEMPSNDNSQKQKKFITKIANNSNDKGFKEFIERLYCEVPHYDLVEMEEEHLYQSAVSFFKTFKQRKAKDFNVNIYKPAKNSDYAVLEIINLDIPFLVDSIGNELKSQQFDIRLIVHPTLHVNRDTKGNFINFESNSPKESILQFHILNWCDDSHYKHLLKRITKILECVNYAVEDWGRMRGSMENAIKAINDCAIIKDLELKSESISFLEWLVNKHLVFLGAVECEIKDDKVIPVNSTKLGLAKSDLYPIDEIAVDAQYTDTNPLFIRKWETRSVVHRTAHMDCIVVKKFDAKGKCNGAYMFLGLFASTVYYQSVRNIPLMRKKIDKVVNMYGYPESSHNGKELVTAMEAFPRGELLQMSVEELYNTSTGIVSLSLMPRVRAFLRKDRAEKFISAIVFIPETRFSTEVREVIEDIMCRHLGGSISKRYVHIGEASLTRLQLIVKTQPHHIPKYNVADIEQDIVHAISVWSDELQEYLLKKHDKRTALTQYKKYKDAFNIKYTATFSGKQAVHDVRLIEECLSLGRVCFDLYTSSQSGGKEYTQLKIYSPDKELALSSTLPIIENLGLFAVDVETYHVEMKDMGETQSLFIHHFRLKSKSQDIKITEAIKENVDRALDEIWANEIEDDEFNSLIIHSNLTWREANMVRAYAKYLKQTDFPHSPEYALEALVNNTEITSKLVELFNLKFDPAINVSNNKINKKIEEINEGLGEIKSITEDKVIRSYLQVILATKRTNYFQKASSGKPKCYMSFKIFSGEVLDLPMPRPHAEIFVYSPRFEAVHLRGGKVARGGLRWSDRKEDFRTEVLGLMKAQMTKNSVIVPVGSKGGFVVKKVSMADGREEFMNEGIECYKMFLSGLLDVTDNVVKGKIVAPKDVVRHDDDDPYLVVAADKGTATFSDFANEVSDNCGFWLSDAFASGGSAGYDHKKMGITAKGAWVSVERHFKEIGINIDTTPFTVAGIGDMAGDVFGNGMLLSKNIKLVAAFNHMHIFIDPNPDPAKSFKERQRMFNKPRSAWTDYNEKLMSKGGGIYDRKAKSITISSEAAEVLGVQEKTFAPDDLINAILKAPVDLLWNGGIGTYIKAESEANSAIGDKANDSLRVNGSELRCQMFGEGGNLGATQLGRIEFAKHGGKINTDFIDNSAGVDCSDHEVNLKIAVSDSVRSGKIKMGARNKLLDAMTDNVSDLVLRDNYVQTQLITIEEQAKRSRINAHAWLIRHLENKGELDRDIEYLPSTEDINAIIAEKGRLTRPEISVLVAYAKNSAYQMLCANDFTKEKHLTKYLHDYFPDAFKKKYRKLIEDHKLKNEILTTIITNDFVNMLGCTFFHQVMEDYGFGPSDIAKAFLIVREIFNVDEYWKEVENLLGEVPTATQVALFKELQGVVQRNTIWILRNCENLEDLGAIISKYRPHIDSLKKNVKSFATHLMQENYEQQMLEYKENEICEGLAHDILITKMVIPGCDIIKVSDQVGESPEKIAEVYYRLGESMHLTWMLSQASGFAPKQYFQTVALRALVSEINDIQMQLTINNIKKAGISTKKDVICCIANPDKLDKYHTFITELKGSDTSDALVAMLTIAVKRVKEFIA